MDKTKPDYIFKVPALWWAQWCAVLIWSHIEPLVGWQARVGEKGTLAQRVIVPVYLAPGLTFWDEERDRCLGISSWIPTKRKDSAPKHTRQNWSVCCILTEGSGRYKKSRLKM